MVECWSLGVVINGTGHSTILSGRLSINSGISTGSYIDPRTHLYAKLS